MANDSIVLSGSKITKQPSCKIYAQKKVHSKHALQTRRFIPAIFFTPTTCPVEIHKTLQAEAPTASGSEMYYFSCESFSWNYKLCITLEQLWPKFPNPESQTSLKHLIYLPMFGQVLSSQPHVEHSLRVMVLLRGSWLPSKLARVSDSKIRLEWNQIRLRNFLVLVMFSWVIQ